MKWGGAVVAALLVAAWIGSAWRYVVWTSTTGDWVSVDAGRLVVGQFGPGSNPAKFRILRAGSTPGFTRPPGWHSGETLTSFSSNWWFSGTKLGSFRVRAAPLWVLVAPTVVLTGAAWRRDAIARRRAMAGCCAECGYDLRGLREGAVCPECGTGPARGGSERLHHPLDSARS